MFVNKISHISRAHILKSKMYFNVKSSTYYFHMKAKTLADFEMCISVPLILATAYSHKLGKYGGESILSSSKCIKVYKILQLLDTIWHEKCLALPFFHAFTGCNSACSFYCRGNCKFLDRWMKIGDCHNITEAFTVLNNAPESID